MPRHATDLRQSELKKPVQRYGRALDWLNFSLADVQTGIGPFLAAALTARRWNPAQIGTFLTVSGLLGVFLQLPAGAFVDATRRKRALIAVAVLAIVAASLLLAFGRGFVIAGVAQLILGAAGPFIGPAVAAITLGLVGKALFDARIGRNQSFDSAGNVCAAVLMGWVGWRFGMRAVFLIVPILSIPAFLSLAAIPGNQIDYWGARGGREDAPAKASKMAVLVHDRALLALALAAFLFHFANAAMLPQLGEMLSQGRVRTAAPFMAAAVTVTQFVIAVTASTAGKLSARWGPRPLLIAGFGVLPIRGVLYTLTSSVPPLVAIQVLDGIANSIFPVATAVYIADRTRGSGRFNLTMGAFGMVVGIGAALSNAVGGVISERLGFRVSFLVLAGIAAAALIWLILFVPNTRAKLTLGHGADTGSPPSRNSETAETEARPSGNAHGNAPVSGEANPDASA